MLYSSFFLLLRFEFPLSLYSFKTSIGSKQNYWYLEGNIASIWIRKFQDTLFSVTRSYTRTHAITVHSLRSPLHSSSSDSLVCYFMISCHVLHYHNSFSCAQLWCRCIIKTSSLLGECRAFQYREGNHWSVCNLSCPYKAKQRQNWTSNGVLYFLVPWRRVHINYEYSL